jgi:hypothetical protein|tara:strand:+ start:5176 stop:5646 length:471 start_codon:yes stop_codon:yes gene_type:complete
MTEELKNSTNTEGDKNWKETREKLAFLEGRVAEYEEKERVQIFKDAGLDLSKGIGKAVDKLYEGELTVEGIQQYASEEFGVDVDVGRQDGIQEVQENVQAVENSQAKLDNIQKSSVADVFGEDIEAQIAEISAKGTPRQSIAAKLLAMEEDKANSK